MSPDISEVIQKLLTDMEKIIATLKEGEMKQAVDEYVFCFENCDTIEDIEMHITNKIPSLTPELGTILCQTFILMIPDEESEQAYLGEAEECAKARPKAKKDQGEVSTAKAPASE